MKPPKFFPGLVLLSVLLGALPFCSRPNWLVQKYGPKQYSQYDEELIIRDFFQDKRNGFFVDVGAGDYRLDSTTYYLEERLGWHGIAVEAIGDYEEGYLEHRKNTLFLNYFVSDRTDKRADFYLIPENKRMSSGREDWAKKGGKYEKIEVPAITLNDLLKKAGVTHLDLLSMDIENAEPAALSGFDIDAYRPTLVCIEAHPQVRALILDYFEKHDYVRLEKYARLDRVNFYFTPRGEPPAPALRSSSAVAARTEYFQGAGIRSSTYGRPNDPGPGYWARTGVEIAAKFPGAAPEAIWIASRLKGRGTEMSFPVPPGGDPLITGMPEDISEPILQLFDKLGYRVWLQTEPGWAPVDKAFHVMLDHYGHHKCVVGVGVDIEWHRSNNPDRGDPVTDEMARTWLAAARSHNPAYRMFLKHFRENVMPPTFRDGIMFVDDSQIFKSSDAMIEEFAKWGKFFAPSRVGFQYGYRPDKPWWGKMKDPVKEIGDRILAATPNCEALIWVDFSIRDVFPPDPAKGDRVPPIQR